MTDQPLTDEERKRRRREKLMRLSRNARILRKLGFVEDLGGDRCEGHSTKWNLNGTIWLETEEADFHRPGDVIEAVARRAYCTGRDEVRAKMREAIGVF